MFESVECVIEIVILVLAIGLLSGDRGMFDSNPKYMSSNPGVGAAIGNAANAIAPCTNADLIELLDRSARLLDHLAQADDLLLNKAVDFGE